MFEFVVVSESWIGQRARTENTHECHLIQSVYFTTRICKAKWVEPFELPPPPPLPPPPSLSLSLSSQASDPKLAWSRSAAERYVLSEKGVHRAMHAVDTDKDRTCNVQVFVTTCTGP